MAASSRPSSSISALVLVLSLFSHVVAGISLDLDSIDSIKSVASTIAFDMMTYYKGNLSGQIPGMLPGPPLNPTITNAGYFWWESGAMWGSLIDYWYYTGDSTYNNDVSQGLLFQVGANSDYLPQNQSNGMGNDDQGFWGMSAMTAAELNFPNPPPTQPQWLALAQAVFNSQYSRLDSVCGGGLRWQTYSVENGYNYKNSIANGCFFNIAARLAAYTGNTSYATHAETSWEWIRSVGLIDDDYNVYDGATTASNCTSMTKLQFSYNAGIYLLGAATMYNVTNGSDIWRERVNGMVNRTLTYFFPDGIAYEQACEASLVHCTIDMLSYKAFLTRWMAAATKVAPFIYDQVFEVLQTSAKAAALQCSGSPADHPNGRMCGLSWSKGAAWDGTSGVGQQMAALEVITSNLISQSRAPLTNKTGGTSQGNPAAGIGGDGSEDPTTVKPATRSGRVGAGFLTAAVVIAVVSGLVWVSFPDGKGH